MRRILSVGRNIFLGATACVALVGQTNAQTYDKKIIGQSLLTLSLSIYTCGEEVRRNAAEAALAGGNVRDADQTELDNCKSASMERFERTKNDLKEMFSADSAKLSAVREWYGHLSEEFGLLWASGTNSELVAARMTRENTKLQADLLF